ncbi:hypothetical protein WA1_20940 [Scytonema hofmannii PCC 7110]|uniref:Uncharacterized protein n=1 Tax=Scytonema hofmannii PCC 7110 TaxID=128403 RepID=A0A139XCQ4_9CYAN|nr:hypothetical protein [Scytonema hofmannii]KYC42433.1 hypothetical protein WA1_20940 [Scytonema hofmannii PCC 7110]
MPLVFVHGVNVRFNDRYNSEVRARNALFRKFALRAISPNPQESAILNPFWGNLGVQFRWDYACLPREGSELFGESDEDVLALLVGETLGKENTNPDTVLLEVARISLIDATDLLWTAAAQKVTTDIEAESLSSLAEHTTNYVYSNPKPDWLNNISNDDRFISELAFHVKKWADLNRGYPEPEVFGIDEAWEQLGEARLRVQNAVSRLASHTLLSLVRESVNEMVTRFLGDAFVYLNKRGTLDAPGEIVSEVIAALVQAQQIQMENPDDSKLIVVAHSMGGNIMYDILSYFLPKLHPDLNVDVFVTVGSQVGAFEEMKLFRASDETLPQNSRLDRVSPLTNVAHWLNVFDNNDVFAFAVENIFEGTKDFRYSTGKGLLMAHSSYFTMLSFHKRLAERLGSIVL